jgi:hypothetical protein
MHVASAAALGRGGLLLKVGSAVRTTCATGKEMDSAQVTLREPITPGSYVHVVEVHGRRGRIDSPGCGWLSIM